MTWFSEMCDEMEDLHGERGWKRRLAETLGVSDSNVQNWIRAGDAPPIVKTAYEATRQVRELKDELKAWEHDNYVIEDLKDGLGCRVLVHDINTGHFAEIATTKGITLARAVVRIDSGDLDRKIAQLADRIEYFIERHPDDQAVLRDLLNWNKPTRREVAAEVEALFSDCQLTKGASDDE